MNCLPRDRKEESPLSTGFVPCLVGVKLSFSSSGKPATSLSYLTLTDTMS